MNRKLLFKILTWVVTDGTIVHRSVYNKRVQFKLSKQRKINRLKELLDRANLKYTFREATMSGVNKLQPYYICLYGDDARLICNELDQIKQFPKDWVYLEFDEALSVLEEIENTDGHRQNKPSFYWVSTDKHNVDIISRLCNAHNINFKFKIYNSSSSGFANGKIQFHSKIDINRNLYG